MIATLNINELKKEKMISTRISRLHFPGGSVIPATHNNNATVSALEAELDARNHILNLASLVTITDRNGTIIYANDHFCRVSGYSRCEVLGRTHELIRHPELHDDSVSGIWRTIFGGESWNGTLKSRKKDGENFWTKTVITPVFNDSGIPEKFIWVRHDITSLKRKEQELFKAKQRADQQLLANMDNANRIQQAMLPSEDELREIFPESFTLFSPLQSVSGDFYFFTSKRDISLIALGDGTGHGVSASLVSMMALAGLKHCVEKATVIDPGVALSCLNRFVLRMLNKDKASGLTESVDMALCSYNHALRQLNYASAQSRIYVVRHNEVIEGEQDDFSVGSGPQDFSYSTFTLQLEKGDRVYMMSDGLQDQFGGQKNKRLGSRQLKELLKFTRNLPLQQQKEIIRKNFLNWKGSNEQTDDISIIAFEVE